MAVNEVTRRAVSEGDQTSGRQFQALSEIRFVPEHPEFVPEHWESALGDKAGSAQRAIPACDAPSATVLSCGGAPALTASGSSQEAFEASWHSSQRADRKLYRVDAEIVVLNELRPVVDR